MDTLGTLVEHDMLANRQSDGGRARRSRSLRASVYVGLVGGLAIALGVGAALLGGVGIACADTGGSSSSAGSSSAKTAGSASSEKASEKSSDSATSASSAVRRPRQRLSRQTPLPRPAPRRPHHLISHRPGPPRRRPVCAQQRVSARGDECRSIWSTETRPRSPQRLVGNLGCSCHVVGPVGTCGVGDPGPAETHRCAKRCALDAGTIRRGNDGIRHAHLGYGCAVGRSGGGGV